MSVKTRRNQSGFFSLVTPRPLALSFFVVVLLFAAKAQAAWFIDGYHGGVHGHYPPGYTAFLVEQLRKNPDWRISLEIEPETWDIVRTNEPEAYAGFKNLMADQSDSAQIEIVNPSYAQS